MNIADREKVLGFKPQRENIYSSLLPYASKLDDESNRHLLSIKTHLARTIQLRDLKHGASHWCTQLTKYIRLYGFKFSKEDHLTFVHLIYDLVVIPDLDYALVTKFSLMLTKLLQKSNLLSSADLEIPWRQLYDIYTNMEYGKLNTTDIISSPPRRFRKSKRRFRFRQRRRIFFNCGRRLSLTLQRSLVLRFKNLIITCRDYFPLSSTQEMLDELRPYLCPRDTYMHRGLKMLELFLPTRQHPDHRAITTDLFFVEFMTIWEQVQNPYSFEGKLVNLMSRLALDQCGYIDWEPYMPMLFNRFLRSLNLPINKGVHMQSKDKIYDHFVISEWMVAMLGPNTSCQHHLENFMNAIESFYHPSNNGKWNNKLQYLLQKLVEEFSKRIHYERIHKTHFHETPASARLTDDCIKRFVACLEPIVQLALFDKSGADLAAETYRRLNSLSGANDAFQTSVEHHRLISLVLCFTSVCPEMIGMRSMIQPPYKFGRHQILPLLHMCLPGIDSNDPYKCFKVLRMIRSLIENIPIEDYTPLVNSEQLTQEEIDLCLTTDQFEDFALLFLDRILVLVENSALSQITIESPHTRSPLNRDLSSDEHLVEKYATDCMLCLSLQASDRIYMKVYNKFKTYVLNTVPELNISGYFMSSLLSFLIKGRQELSFDDMMDSVLPNITNWLAANHTYRKDEHLDNYILWNLTILHRVTAVATCAHLEKHMPALSSVISSFLDCDCSSAVISVNSIVENCLSAFTTATLNLRCERKAARTLIEKFRSWGEQYTPDTMNIVWKMPRQQDVNIAADFLKLHLLPQLDIITKYIESGATSMTRDKLKLSLDLIGLLLNGVSSFLDPLPGEPLNISECMVDQKRFNYIVSIYDVESITIDGENVRLLVLNKIKELLNFLLLNHENDTKSLVKIVAIFEVIAMDFGMDKIFLEYYIKKYTAMKKAYVSVLDHKKVRDRTLLFQRIKLQHQLRLHCRVPKVVNAHIAGIIKDLFRISTSRYSKVRKCGQRELSTLFNTFQFAYRIILDDILECLKVDPNDENSRSKYQGAIYVMIGETRSSYMTRRNWSVQCRLWPAVLQLKHSDKTTDQQLIDKLIEKSSDCLETIEINIVVTDKAIESADSLYNNDHIKITTKVDFELPVPRPTSEEMKHGLEMEQLRNKTSLEDFMKLCNSLCDLIENGNLWWKFFEISMNMLSVTIHHEVAPQERAVRILVDNLVHESAYVRFCCIYELGNVLVMMKRPHKKIVVDRSTLPHYTAGPVKPGERLDNRWLQIYEDDSKVKYYDTEETWNNTVLIDKTHFGYYCWPKELLTYAPYEQQPQLNRPVEDMSPVEQVIFRKFTCPEYLEHFFRLIIVESGILVSKKFSVKNYTFFKSLFRLFGEPVFEQFKPYLTKMSLDSVRDTHQVNQRRAVEISTAVCVGAKHWPRDMTKNLWAYMIPMFKACIPCITNDTINDWMTGFATISSSRDPKRLIDLFDLLMDNPINPENGSFVNSTRLYALQGVLAQQEWRIPYYLHQVKNLVAPNIGYSYKNVRDRIANIIVDINLNDYSLTKGEFVCNSPLNKDFVHDVINELKRIKPLFEFSTEDIVSTDSTMGQEKNVNIRVVKTIMSCVQGTLIRSLNIKQLNFYRILPIICGLNLDSVDDDIKKECTMTLTYLGYCTVNAEFLPDLFASIETITKSNLWKAKDALLNFIQLTVFYNYFILLPYNSRIFTCVKTLLRDSSVEVREKAAMAMTGFILCGYFKVDDKMIKEFVKMSRTKLIKYVCTGQQQPSSVVVVGEDSLPVAAAKDDTVSNDFEVANSSMKKRHAGVLGLSAIVLSSPYDISVYLPDILITLVDHVYDPQPISTSVRKTLMLFKHTHMDSWQEHKNKFTFEQLTTLNDLLISPNYYA